MQLFSAITRCFSIEGYRPDRAIGWWLLLCAGMVVLMVAIGGATRLTESGLSMVEWKPLTGFIPPVSDEAWMELFTAYKTSPEYQKINFGMSIYEFKQIFWLEFIHRLVGRLTGIIFLVPLVYFIIRRRLRRPFILRYGMIFLLGGLQGLMGWYMVKSGLVDNPWVSPYRLMAHFLIAQAIFALLIWQAMHHLHPRPAGVQCPGRGVRGLLLATGVVFFVQLCYGAFVAGLDAGFIYNDFPMMVEGHFFPEEPWKLSPLLLNLTENIATVQFIHRWLAFICLGCVFALFIASRAEHGNRGLYATCELLLIVVTIQIVLGLFTLMMVVPTDLAVLHQVTATLITGLLVFAFYEMRILCKQTSRPN